VALYLLVFKEYIMDFETVKEGPLMGQLVRLPCSGPSVRIHELEGQKRGLSYTASGYGAKIPTRYMVRTIDQKWRRVYCAIFSNIGTTYVVHGNQKTIVEVNP
jgi:hypothetical protein